MNDGEVTLPSRKLRVLCLHTAQVPPLGADTWVHATIIEQLDRARHHVHVAYAPGRHGVPTPTAQVIDAVPEIERVHVDLGREDVGGTGWREVLRRLVDAGRAAWSVARLTAYARRNDIDVIHTSDRPRDALVAVVVGRIAGVPSVVHLHVKYAGWMRRSLRWAIRHADARIAVSRFVGDSVPEEVRSTTHVVLNAIVLDGWTPRTDRARTRAEFGVADACPLVLTVCRLFPEKGVATLIDAVALVRSEGHDLRLLVVGADMSNGEYEAELRALVHRSGLESTVTFTGRRNDVARLMGAADIFAMPSFEEPFGLVFAEAMAMELPVVALDSGGAPEVVVHDATGLLSAPGDDRALAANLRTLLNDPQLRTRLGVAGRQRVIESFTADRMAADTADAYRLVLSRRRPAAGAGEERTEHGAVEH